MLCILTLQIVGRGRSLGSGLLTRSERGRQPISLMQFVGHILAPKSSTFGDLAPLLRRKAGLPDGTELSIFEEIKFEPTVMCQPQRPQDTLMNSQLEHGDILCIQEAVSPVSDLSAVPVLLAMCWQPR